MEKPLSVQELLQLYDQGRGTRLFEGVKITGPGTLQDADLRNVTFRQVKFHEVNFTDAQLGGVLLDHVIIEFSRLERTDLTRANLLGVTFKICHLPGVILQGASLQQVTFEPPVYEPTDLRNAVLRWARLVEIDFHKANLAGADLVAAYLNTVDISGADLRQVKIGRTEEENIIRDAATLWEPIQVPDASAGRARRQGTGGQRKSALQASPLGATEYIRTPDGQAGICLEQAKNQVHMMLQERFGRAGRSGQPKFRAVLFEVYQGRCALTGCTLEATLEAAHIYPHCLCENYEPANGILLRSDLHDLFDWNLLRIDPQTRRIFVDPRNSGGRISPLTRQSNRCSIQ